MLQGITLLTSFVLAMTAIVLIPKLMERFKLPGVLGFILAGFIMGPGVLNIIHQDGPVITFMAELGKLLFMFFVGFEIDLDDFKRTRTRSMTFGALTFILPCAAGVALGRLTGNSWNASLLIGSIIASHTLLAFPILLQFGLAQHPTVLMVVGGTIFTDIASMLLLAVCVSVHITGFSWGFLGSELLQLAIFAPLVLFGAGTLARKAIIRYGQTAEVRVMIMLLVIALCAEGAQRIQLEGIVGAFLAGIAVKRAVRGKFAVQQLEVVAHALFIPSFFLTTGFLINPAAMKQTLFENPVLTFGLLAAVFGGKILAARATGRLFSLRPVDCRITASLSFPQMAATLASAVVGYQSINAAGERLLSKGFVNAVLVVVITTCILGPILTKKDAALLAAEPSPGPDTGPPANPSGEESPSPAAV